MPTESNSRRKEAATPVLAATLSDVTGLANLLRSVALQQNAVVIASESGLEIVTELNRTLQAHAYLYSHMFDTYDFRAPPTAAASSRRSRTSSRPSKRARTSSSPPAASGSSPTQSEQSDAGEAEDDDNDDQEHAWKEPASTSFEVNLQTLLSCLNIFGGVGSARPSSNSFRGGTATDGGGGARGGYGTYQRTREATAGLDGAGGAGAERFAFNTPKATRMKLTYQGMGHALVLELEQEANVLTTCSISTYEAGFLTDLVFDPARMVSQVIVGSEVMHSAFSEIDQSCKKLSILVSPPTVSHSRSKAGAVDGIKPNMLRFKAISDSGSSEMEYPAGVSSSDPTGVIEKFVALPESQEQWYDFTLLSRTMTVLRSSIKTSIRTDQDGLISFQFMMPKYRKSAGAGAAAGGAAVEDTDEQDAFCEFLCCPLDTQTLII
ncbi:Rad1-domain-containing protein [Testicularia cyperi]|uniref:Rad1-domain-containing protein n=1 Tax=Testicularia cyperi TaxID=1882483 RepID=A0A317XQZ7_9BASI|nr:Rad1-domain-containing protein [Testicularia cyperi]